MDKLVIFPGRDERGVYNFVIDTAHSHLEKTAAEYHPTIASYINNAKPIPGKTQVLLTALGAGEWWGHNRNGDFFPEEALAHEGEDYGYKTFEKFGNVYRHHLNKPAKGHIIYGSVALSVYNPRYHRVELIVLLNHSNASDLVDRIESGEEVAWSMGTNVPFDMCSICGNKAPTRKQYCDHLKYYIGRIPPGFDKVAYAINTRPKFFDISYVLIPADKTALTLKKVAGFGLDSSGLYISSALLAEKAAAATKSATIEKEVPANDPPYSQESIKDLARGIMHVKAQERPLPTQLLNRLGEFPLSESMSTLAMLGILPKPQEFQRIVLVRHGRPELADELDSRGMAFDPMMVEDSKPEAERALGLSSDNFSSRIMQLLQPFMADRSYAAPLLGKRLTILIKTGNAEPELPSLIKSAEDKERKPVGIIPVLMASAALYAAFAKNAPKEAVKGIDKLVADHPGLAAALGVGLVSTFGAMLGAKTKGQHVDGVYENPDTNDVYARIEREKLKPYSKTAGVKDNVGGSWKRLFIGIPAAYMASGIMQKHREHNPYDEEGRIRSFVRRNPDLISGALAADAMLALKGKGTHGLLTAHMPKIKSHFDKGLKALENLAGTTPTTKVASAQDYLSNALVWPLAVGGGGLPGRIVGGLFDQAALDVTKQLIEKRNKKRHQS